LCTDSLGLYITVVIFAVILLASVCHSFLKSMQLSHDQTGWYSDEHLDYSVSVLAITLAFQCFFGGVIPFYLQSEPVYSANCVKTYSVACRRVLSSVSL
jgi:hypothetical protein